jgi:polar amino acid transport system permease protein
MVTFLYGMMNRRLNRHLPSNQRSRIRLRPQIIR